MYKDYKIVVVTPSGRSRYQKILFEYIKKHKDIIDEYRLWINTTNKDDLKWFSDMSNEYDWIKLDMIPNLPKIGTSNAIHRFFKRCTDENTIYIRLDDDIVFLEENFFTNLLDFRIENTEYFLVSANIINNAICSHIHQRIGAVDETIGLVNYECMDRVGWMSGESAAFFHENFIRSLEDNTYKKYFFDKWILNRYERFSINSICWFGIDMQLLNGKIEEEEETDITTNKPKILNKYNAICGNALCSHFSFFTQRDFLDNSTNLNTIYQNLVHNYNKSSNLDIVKDIQVKNIQPKSKINHNAFYRYKNKFTDKSIVIFGNGPTVNNYIPIQDTINIGCNRCIYYDKLIFDFYFYNDWRHAGKQYKEDILNYQANIDKFFGTFPFDRGFGASEKLAKDGGAVLYDMEGPSGRKYGFQKEIDKYYMGDIGQSIVFVMMQFALYLNPKEIYIVGCDIDNVNSTNANIKYFHHQDHLPNSCRHSDLKKWWKEMKKFIDINYNHIKVTSVNPVGLKGYFNDIYQHPIEQ